MKRAIVAETFFKVLKSFFLPNPVVKTVGTFFREYRITFFFGELLTTFDEIFVKFWFRLRHFFFFRTFFPKILVTFTSKLRVIKNLFFSFKFPLRFCFETFDCDALIRSRKIR